MTKKKIWIGILIGGLAIVTVAALGVGAFIQTAQAAATSIGMAPTIAEATNLMWAHGGPGRPDGMENHETYLAEALGITVEELQAARQEANEAALAAAVEAGWITQEQADQIQTWGDRGFMGRFGFGHGRGFGAKGMLNYEGYLADALGISVEELQNAQDTAHKAALTQAVEDGVITQEEADLKLAMSALKNYIDKDALLSEVLGISLEDLQDALAEGKSMPDLLAELDLTPEDVRAAMETAREDAVQQAVEDGVITQEQADQIQSEEFGFGPRGPGFRGPGFGGRGFHGGRGGGRFGGFGPFQNRPDTTTPSGLGA